MFWVIQENIFNEEKHEELLNTLEEMDIPHTEVKVVPFSDKLLPTYFDSHIYEGSLDDLSEEYINDKGLVMVCGSLSLSRIAKERGWIPGNFLNDNFHYEKWLAAYKENLLNSESLVDAFHNINPPWDTFFTRPCEDNKDFNGTVFTKEEFNEWRSDWLSKEERCPFKYSQVVASPTKRIHSEYRFFVVDGKVVTGSQYKKGPQLFINSNVDKKVSSFAQKMVNIWQPARAFVIDIAETTEGLKVIEINNFNSAGFYASDVRKIVEAIEGMKF